MHKLLGWLFPVLFVLLLLLDFAFWGGVRAGPAGPQVLRSAQKEAPLALAYMHGGEAVLATPGLRGWAEAFARRRAGHAYAAIDAAPEAAMDILMRALPGTMRMVHLGPPVLLLLWGLWYWLRPRQLHTIRRR